MSAKTYPRTFFELLMNIYNIVPAQATRATAIIWPVRPSPAVSGLLASHCRAADTLVSVCQGSPARTAINVSRKRINTKRPKLYVPRPLVPIITNNARVCRMTTSDVAVEFDLTKYFSPEFNGKNSFLSIPLTEDLRRSTRLEIWFGTTSETNTGLLLYSGQSYTGQGDFISVYLSDGHVQLTYDLGNGKTNVT